MKRAVRPPRFLAAALLASCIAAGAATRPEESRAERDTLAGVINALDHKDCARAVSRLNAGLSSRYPGVYLMAGTMYEEGLCLKPNWERAERMYRLAHEAGHGAGLLRLVAGLAQGGRDSAAAVWWAQQTTELPLVEDCRVPQRIWSDPDLFVATIKLWPAARLAGCVYVAGVMAHVAGDLEYPGAALAGNLGGTVELDYTPAQGSMQWRTVDLDKGVVYGLNTGDSLAEGNSRKTRASLERTLGELGAQALKRFEQPAGIDPAWRVQTRWVFTVILKNVP